MRAIYKPLHPTAPEPMPQFKRGMHILHSVHLIVINLLAR